MLELGGLIINVFLLIIAVMLFALWLKYDHSGWFGVAGGAVLLYTLVGIVPKK